MPSPSRFWPPRGEFPSAPLLGATHHGLGAFCTEKGVISGVLGCPEEVAALRLGCGEEEKVGGNGKTPGGSPRSSCHAESSPERKFLRNVGAASSREPGPAHRTFACLTPPPPTSPSLCGGPVGVTLQLPLWERGPPGSLSRSYGWGGSSGLPEDPGLITSPLSLHQLSGKSCGSLSCYLELGWTEEGRAEVSGACGKSEAVPSSRTVPTE